MKSIVRTLLCLMLAALLCLSLLPAALASGEPESSGEFPGAAGASAEAPVAAPIEEPAGEPVEEPSEEPSGEPTGEPAAEAVSDIPLDEAHFPDANFRAKISRDYDSDEDGMLSDEEIADIQYLFLFDEGITSLEGIGYLTALISLYCTENPLTSMDLSRNTALETLECNDNQLTSLDISHNTALKYLSCTNNQLTSLDVSGNPALERLYCQQNQLTSLDLSGKPELKLLRCDENALTDLDVTDCPILAELVLAGKTPAAEPGNTSTSWFYEEGDPDDEETDGLWFYIGEDIRIVLVKALICDRSVTVTAGDTVIPGGSTSPDPITVPLGVAISEDGQEAQAFGDWSGLYARVALTVEIDGRTGLYVQQAEIGEYGEIMIPAMDLPGISVTGVSVALVPTLEDIQSPTPDVEAMDFWRTNNNNTENPEENPTVLQRIFSYIKDILHRFS